MFVHKKLKEIIKSYKKIIDIELQKYLSKSCTHSSLLKKAMKYAVFSGGKRLRPIMVLASCRACGGAIRKALPAACALEMVHAYSLVHDDLPAMDDDNLRRGTLTTHKKFGEAVGILAGDALLTKAFEILSKNDKIKKLSPLIRLEIIRIIADAAGMAGMVGGQTEDIRSEKLPHSSINRVFKIHAGKTGALITASALSGGLSAGAGYDALQCLAVYGASFGLAFQIMDDVLDIIGDKKKLGKRGSDNENNKVTFPSIWGIEKSMRYARDKVSEAIQSLASFGREADPLRWLAVYVVERDH